MKIDTLNRVIKMMNISSRSTISHAGVFVKRITPVNIELCVIGDITALIDTVDDTISKDMFFMRTSSQDLKNILSSCISDNIERVPHGKYIALNDDYLSHRFPYKWLRDTLSAKKTDAIAKFNVKELYSIAQYMSDRYLVQLSNTDGDNIMVEAIGTGSKKAIGAIARII